MSQLLDCTCHRIGGSHSKGPVPVTTSQRGYGKECARCAVHADVTCLSFSSPCVFIGSTFYQDFSRHRGDSEATGDPSALWPPVEPVGPAWPSPQQPLPLQPGSYPAGGDLEQIGVPVPLYSVPEARLPGIGGNMAVTEAPGGRPWAETQQPHPPPGKTCSGSLGCGVLEGRSQMGRGRDQWGAGKDLNGVCTWWRACWVSALVLVCMQPGEIALSLPLSSPLGQAQGDQQQRPPWAHSF